MIFSVHRPLYFISHTKSQRLLVTRQRLSCEKVNLRNKLVTRAWDSTGNLVPRAFPLKNGWGPTHFLREKPWGRGCSTGYPSSVHKLP